MDSTDLIGIGSSAASSIFGAVAGTSKLQSKRWRRDQDWLMGRQYDQWQKQFDYEASYNSPAAQMQRYREAGINPNLIYGNGTGTSGNVAFSPGGNGSAPVAGMVDGSASVNAVSQMVQNFANLQYTRALTRDVNADATRKETENPYAARMIQSRISNLDAQTQNFLDTHHFYDLSKDVQLSILSHQDANIIQQTSVMAYQLEHLLPANVNAQIALTDNYKASKILIQKQYGLTDAQASYYTSQCATAAALAYKYYEEGRWTGKVSEAQIAQLMAAAANQTAQSEYWNQKPDIERSSQTNLYNMNENTNATRERGQNLDIFKFGLSSYGMYKLFQNPPKGFSPRSFRGTPMGARGIGGKVGGAAAALLFLEMLMTPNEGHDPYSSFDPTAPDAIPSLGGDPYGIDDVPF